MNLKRNIYIMYAIALLQGMVFYAPIATLYRQAVGLTIFQITLIESISMALTVILEMPWGVVADKIGYKKTMILCSVFFFISKIVFWKATGFGGFLIERIILSIVISGLSGVDISILYLSCREERAQTVFGIYNNLTIVGTIFASGIYSLIIGSNYRLAGFLTVISYGIATFLSLWLKEVKPNDEKNYNTLLDFTSNLKSILKNKYLIIFLIAVALLNETHQTITVFINQLQYVKCGMSEVEIGYIFLIVTLIGLVGGLSSYLTKKLGVRCLSNAIFLASFASCLVLTYTSNKFLSIMSIVLIRICFSLFEPLQTDLQNKQVNTSNRATSLSINAVIIDSVGIATNIVFGKLADINLSYSMMLGACFCLTGFFLFSVWYKKCAYAI